MGELIHAIISSNFSYILEAKRIKDLTMIVLSKQKDGKNGDWMASHR